jgi:hypothetical protein
LKLLPPVPSDPGFDPDLKRLAESRELVGLEGGVVGISSSVGRPMTGPKVGLLRAGGGAERKPAGRARAWAWEVSEEASAVADGTIVAKGLACTCGDEERAEMEEMEEGVTGKCWAGWGMGRGVRAAEAGACPIWPKTA